MAKFKEILMAAVVVEHTFHHQNGFLWLIVLKYLCIWSTQTRACRSAHTHP